MASASDMRIPVVFGDGTPADAYLVEGDRLAPPGLFVARFTPADQGLVAHPAGCACCRPRGAAARAMAAMFLARATGAAPWFSRVVVFASPSGEAAVRDAMQDPLMSARYRL